MSHHVDMRIPENAPSNGLLFRFVGRFMGSELLPREIYGLEPSTESRFWTSYLRAGEFFIWQGYWYQVVVNRLDNVSDLVQRYIFYAVPENFPIREE